ncbi:MAG: VWA domain-containing protein [Myxococcales bacterium]|nr:VWA domain-containing protein [Myxococcales bacterium]
MRKRLPWRLALVLGAIGWMGACAAGGTTETDPSCPVGAETCSCTKGGACDPGLECLSGLCVDPNSTPTSSGQGGSGTGGSTTSQGGGFVTSSGTGGGDCQEGCQAVDVLFALDSSGSMVAENSALAATAAFQQVATQIAAVNCGSVDYRIGVTDDNDAGFVVPNGWSGAHPWFDSLEMTQAEIVTAFESATTKIVQQGQQTPLGCEHVLTSATNLVQSDATGFVRDGALLVLVLVTDVDDYGAYDQPSGNICGLGCMATAPPLQSLLDSLVAKKANDPAAVASIIVAGDPGLNGGTSLCSQPGSCGCAGGDCAAFHAYRLWQFAGMLMGSNGYTASICDGPASVPTAIKDAFAGAIDLACKGLAPPR